MRQAFKDRNFRPETLAIIDQANVIIADYQAQGFSLTVRQIYYQFVARGLIENTQRAYKRVVSILNDGRMTGRIDWSAIEDRTRNLEVELHLDSPSHAIRLLRNEWYGIDMWQNQPTRCEVWIEKEALVGVISGVCEELDVPYFACRGFVSQSEQWRAGRRFRQYDQNVVMIHLGDHDPSGMEMTRDNEDRLRMFSGYNGRVEVRRIALNMNQIEQYAPPPYFAKTTDSRFEQYVAEYGSDSWELDALEPAVITQLIRDAVDECRDMDLWSESEAQLSDDKETLDRIIEKLEEDGDI